MRRVGPAATGADRDGGSNLALDAGRLTLRRWGLAIAAAVTTAALVPAAAKAAGHFYGTTIQGAIGGGDARLMREAGARTVRFHLNWHQIQRTPGRCQARAQVGVCDWRDLDGFIGYISSFGLEGFPYPLNVPAFVDPDPNTPPIRSRRDRRAWTGFLEALVKRYGPGGEFWRTQFAMQFPREKPRPIHHWEIWNEPSDGSYWRPKPDPREYGRLLEISGRAIHDTDPRANVLFGGLSGTPDPRNDGIRAPEYYPGVFGREGIGRHVDSIAVHPYGPTLHNLRTQMRWLLNAMSEAGLGDRDVWVTELGWSSSEIPGTGLGPRGQAAQLTRSFELLERRRHKWNVAGVHWYAWQDLEGPGLCVFCPEAGLVTFDRQPKPSYYAFADQTGAEVDGGVPAE